MRIEADQLCVDYNGTVALYDASLHLPAGCICGLVGMNGAGKSTFFKALTGFVRPSRGRIRINGSSVAEAQRHQALYLRARRIDCRDDGALPLPKLRQRVGAVALRTGIAQRASRMLEAEFRRAQDGI